MALSKDATRHVHQKSKKLAQNPTVPKERQDPIRKQRSLHIWHMLFCSNFYSTKITNKLNSRVQLQYLSSYCNHSQIFLNYSKYKRACKMNRKIKNITIVRQKQFMMKKVEKARLKRLCPKTVRRLRTKALNSLMSVRLWNFKDGGS